MIPGHATPDGTSRFAARHPELAFRPLARSGLVTSPVGFGTYRVDEQTPDHALSLEKALLGGSNLIDTSTNYTDGSSERTVGAVLRRLFDRGELRRDEVIVVSKVGYVQGQNLVWAHEREKSGAPIADMVKYQPGCWHCISPEFIEAQLSRSLERLQLECVDFYLLHNPEYFFSEAKKKGAPEALLARRERFYGRIERAFAHLEEEVKRGRLRGYGVSSNTFGNAESDLEATSAETMWRIANRINAPTHFQILQMPLNLFESGPVLELNQGGPGDPGGELTVLDFANRRELGVLVNRPLNAFSRGHMFRLADFPVPATSPQSAAESLAAVQVLEEEFTRVFAPRLQMAEGSVPATELLQWGAHLDPLEEEPLGRFQWDEMERQITEQSNYVLRQLETRFQSEPLWKNWAERYAPRLRELLAAVRARSSAESQRLSNSIASVLDPYLPGEISNQGFAVKAMAVLLNTKGVTCVLNGMRKPSYVEAALAAARLPSFPVPEKLYALFLPGATEVGGA